MFLFAAQASRFFLTVSASSLTTSRKRKRERSASDSLRNGSVMPAASSTSEARRLPANASTAPCSAAAVSASISSTSSVAHHTDGASLADVLPDSISTTGPSKAAAAPPFPFEHYEVTWAQMQAANYPLPAVSESGQKVLPLGFVTATAGQAVCVLWVPSCFMDRPACTAEPSNSCIILSSFCCPVLRHA